MSLAIITITRNDLDGLRRTIASVDEQSVRPHEHLIIDGASTDGTAGYLASLPAAHGRRLVSEPDNGIYDAMNKGTGLASADFVWFLNSGDVCASPDVVATVIAALNTQSDLDGFYGKLWFRTPYGLRSIGRIVTPKDFRYGMAANHPALIYRRSHLIENPYSTRHQIISDWLLTRTLFEKGLSFAYIDCHLSIFDTNGISCRRPFLIIGEQFRHESTIKGKIGVLIFSGIPTARLWLARKTGIYHLYKRWQHRAARSALRKDH
jgi:putative colanic acid biosynthesis glycosyltransferase